METKDNKALSELRRLTECCICLMPFTDPRMLPCIHSACLKCLEHIQTENKKKPGDVIPCPVCRKELIIPPTGIIGLQKNFFIANLLEIMQNFNEETTPQRCQMCKIIDAQKDASEVTMKCLECRETFCERCANVHKFNKLTQGHRIIEIQGNLCEEEILMALPSPNCPSHRHKLLDLYCGDCKAVVCVSCFVEVHTSHSCKDVTTVDKDFRKSLENSSTKMLHYIAQMESEKSKMESNRTKLLEQASEIENAVRLKNQQLKTMIDEHTELVLNELSSMKQRHLKNMEIEVEEIERKMTILKSFKTYCSEIKSKGSPTDVCSCVDGLMRRAGELEKENDEYLSRHGSAFEIIFKTTDHDVLIRNSSNAIGIIEDSTERVKSYAIVLGGAEDGTSVFEEVTKINLHRSDDVSPLQRMPTKMQIESASAVYSNTVYITGIGNNKDEIWKFDAISNVWQKCASLVKGRRRHSVAFVDQFLYICGGYVDSDKSTLDDVDAYDAINDLCSSVGKLVHSVQSAGNCVSFKSSLYIFGGRDANNTDVSHVQVYDTKSNICTLLSHPMPRASILLRAALFEKTVVLLGSDGCFLYDLETGTWQERNQFITEVHHFAMIIDNGEIFVFGGGLFTTDTDGETKWVCRDEVRCIPLKNIIENKAIKWRHHAKLPRLAVVFSCEKIYFETQPLKKY